MVNALVVEDEEGIRELLVEDLIGKGCNVRKANNGAVALQRVAEEKPDIIFVDVVMPVMDGLLFVSELRANPETAEIPVVMVTALSIPEAAAKAEALGIKHCLAKPWVPGALEHVLEQILEPSGLYASLEHN